MKKVFTFLIITGIRPFISFSQSTGNVGIGTANPTNRLQIAFPPEFVFNKFYN